MSDRDSYGCLGSIISLLLLAFLWPYIIGAIGIFIGYLLLLEAISWVARNWLLVGSLITIILALFLAIYYKLLNPILARISGIRVKASFKAVDCSSDHQIAQKQLKGPSIFMPSTNLYCYWCTKKLGLQSWERAGKYYCQSCYQSICNQKLDFER